MHPERAIGGGDDPTENRIFFAQKQRTQNKSIELYTRAE